MGSYAQLFAGDTAVASSKNDYSPRILYLFDRDEMVHCHVRETDLPTCIANQANLQLDDDNDDYKVLYFHTNTSFISDRLSYYGYTKEVADEAFRLWMTTEASQKRELAENDSLKRLSIDLIREADLLESITPDQWVDAFIGVGSSPLRKDINKALGGYHGLFPITDDLVALRLIVDRLPPDADFVYDLTDLHLSEMVDPDTDLFLQEDFSFQDDILSRSRTIVLVEGNTDALILSKFIEFAYPHLKSKLSFFQFDSFSSPGGVGPLATLVKSFAAAGILNRTVAIFDNDTAGHDAMQSIPLDRLPRNIKVIRLPEIDIARNYPTRGPTGVAELDVNGLAASIEMYLGEPALRCGDGQLAEVQWTGFNRKLGRYQGEITKKSEVQKAYFHRLRECPNPSHSDWKDLHRIIDSLVSCFSEDLRKSILGHVDEWSTR